MTDPADMDGASLGEAVSRALGWTTPSRQHFGMWHAPGDEPGHLRFTCLDFTGPGQWAALGLIWEECERRGWLVLFERRVVIVNMNDGDRGHILGEADEPDSVGYNPRALGVAFLRAVAGEGRA